MTPTELAAEISRQRRANRSAAPSHLEPPTDNLAPVLEAGPPEPAGLLMSRDQYRELVRSASMEEKRFFWPDHLEHLDKPSFMGLPIVFDQDAPETTILDAATTERLQQEQRRAEIRMDDLRRSALAAKGVKL